MSWRNRWAVLVPGEVDWVRKRTRELLDEEGYGDEVHFVVIPGHGRYQAVVQEGGQEHSPEILLASHFSLDCGDVVYAIAGNENFPYISRFLKGEEEGVKEQEPEDLVRSLGCTMPWMQEPPRKPLEKPTRTAALIQGLSAARVRKALQKQKERPLPPGSYRMEESSQGVLLAEGKGWLSSALNHLAFQFPLATVYTVIATPDFGFFVVLVGRDRKTLQFVRSSGEILQDSELHEVMGERTPERILAALGIPQEWFRL